MAEIDVQVYEGRKQFKYNFSSANSSFHLKTLLLKKLSVHIHWTLDGFRCFAHARVSSS